MNPIEHRRFRDTCGQFGTGVTIVTTHHENDDHGMTANAFMSVSLEPRLIAISIAERARMLPKLLASGRFAVSILAEGMDDIAWHFAGKPKDHLTGLFERRDGLPLIKGACADFTAGVHQAVPAGDHTVIIGQVLSFASAPGSRPLLFHRGKFGRMADAHAAPPELFDAEYSDPAADIVW